MIVALLLGALAALSGCGSAGTGTPAATVTTATAPAPINTAFPSNTCPAAAMATLGKVLERVYNEGVSSEATDSARHLITSSATLRTALESGDQAGARAAAARLIASGHMTNVTIYRGGQKLADAGAPAMTPIGGPLKNSRGAPIGSYLASVFSAQTFEDEAKGITRGLVSVRSGSRLLAGSNVPVDGPGTAGTTTWGGVRYQYISLPAAAYPSGSLRVYVFRPVASLQSLCRPDREGTVVQTLKRVADQIYEGESGPRALLQVTRVQRDPTLLAAVARKDPAATRREVAALLHEHVVRLRVSAADGTLLDDLGGPYVLAPVYAPLHLNGQRIGEIELSVQDDEGYRRLTKRLAGLDVVMMMNGNVIKNDLGPLSGPIPASGAYSYHGRRFKVFTVNAKAFPSGPLTVRVLVPQPYL
jgi:hypothetical protein